jgi:hypothetical protein
VSNISAYLLVASWATVAACGGDLALPGDGPPGGGGPPTGPVDPPLLNASPSFTPGSDQQAEREKKEDAKERQVEGWATDIRPGPDTEAGQSVTFLAEVVSGAESLVGVPSISPAGTLRYTPSHHQGTARVEVRLRDDGGTEDGGSDTSRPHTLIITVTH